jgi:hypothetical protein
MSVSLQPVAGVDVADRQREKREADGEDNGIQHCDAPCEKYRKLSDARHMNSRGRRTPRYRNLIKIGMGFGFYAAHISLPVRLSRFFMGFSAIFRFRGGYRRHREMTPWRLRQILSFCLIG